MVDTPTGNAPTGGAPGPTHTGGHAGEKAATGLGKRFGPLPVWGWAIVVIAGIAIFIYMRNKNSAANAGSASGTVLGSNGASGAFGSEGFSTNPQGQLVDNATGQTLGTPGNSSSSGGGTAAAAWVAAAESALSNLGYDPAAVGQALQDYSAGNPLTPGEYAIIESAVNQVGGAPAPFGLPVQGGSSGSATTGGSGGGSAYAAAANPPTPSASILADLQPGETFTSAAYNPLSGTWDFLTSLGGLYTLDQNGNATSGGFYGTYLSLPAADRQGTRGAFTTITVNPDGGYTETDSNGEKYTFGPQPYENYATGVQNNTAPGKAPVTVH